MPSSLFISSFNMKKIGAYFILIFSSLLLLICYSPELLKRTAHFFGENGGGFASTRYQYGDLYGLSNDAKFRIPKPENTLKLLDSFVVDSKDLDLVMLGDSYFYSFFQTNANNFERIKQFDFVRWSDKTNLQIPPKSNRKRILLIEVVERNAFDHLQLSFTKKRLSPEKSGTTLNEENPFLVENNLEAILFDHAFFRPFKELKTYIWKDFLKKEIPGVRYSSDGSFMYLSETVEGSQVGNSFSYLSEMEKVSLEKQLNQINSYYLKNGFDKVCLTIIPNPVRVLEKGRKANDLFDFLSTNKNIGLSFVNVLPVLSKNAEQNFYRSDSHWNLKGAEKYRSLVNETLLSFGKN